MGTSFNPFGSGDHINNYTNTSGAQNTVTIVPIMTTNDSSGASSGLWGQLSQPSPTYDNAYTGPTAVKSAADADPENAPVAPVAAISPLILLAVAGGAWWWFKGRKG